MKIAVIGAGTMGTGIAEVCIEAGLLTCLCSRRPESLDGAFERIQKNQAQMVSAGLLSEADARAARERIRSTQDLAEAVHEADFVSENVPETLALKQTMFRDLDRLAPPAAVLSTDTSGLSITAIASVTKRPDRVVGFHWLNPPHLMLPVEVNRGAETSEDTVRATCALAERIGRVPIRVERDVPGFLWNRLQLALLREAIHIVEQGIARPADVDLAVQWGLGLRWAAVGPFRVMDLAGLPTFGAVAAYLFPELSAAQEPQPLLQEAVREGHLGAKVGKGFYDYPPGASEALIQERDTRLMAIRRALTAR
ncbi:MAG: 3-hydroxyacyl-CoA dehydrogenase family protein [Candidatus Methylomirabilia bacterium]